MTSYFSTWHYIYFLKITICASISSLLNDIVDEDYLPYLLQFSHFDVVALNIPCGHCGHTFFSESGSVNLQYAMTFSTVNGWILEVSTHTERFRTCSVMPPHWPIHASQLCQSSKVQYWYFPQLHLVFEIQYNARKRTIYRRSMVWICKSLCKISVLLALTTTRYVSLIMDRKKIKFR